MYGSLAGGLGGNSGGLSTSISSSAESGSGTFHFGSFSTGDSIKDSQVDRESFVDKFVKFGSLATSGLAVYTLYRVISKKGK